MHGNSEASEKINEDYVKNQDKNTHFWDFFFCNMEKWDNLSYEIFFVISKHLL